MASNQAINETARIEAFSDGVFAIALTLLVLEIKVPAPGAAQATSGVPLVRGARRWKKKGGT